MTLPRAGDVYTRPDGALVRIDHVSDDQVYYVAWRPGQEMGCPLRKTHENFAESIALEGMALATEVQP